MRIGFFSDLYPPYLGGQPNRFFELATRLADRGHTVSVHCVATDVTSPLEEVAGGVRVHRWPRDARYDNPIIPPTKRGVTSTLRYAARVRRVLRTERFDVTYFNQWPYLHVLLAPADARRRAAIDWCELREGVVYGAVQRLLPRLVAANFCVNDDLAARLSTLSGRAVGYLPTGVTIEHYHARPSEERDGLLFVGRLVDTKDLPLLVAGYAELWRRGRGIPLRVAGDGALASQVADAVAALTPDARGHVTLLGRVSEEEKLGLLATSQALVVSSRREGFPLVVSEAMASGLPVATVDRADNGTAHVVRRFGIGAVGEPTAAGLADAVEDVLAGWQSYSAHGLAAAADLHWERVVDRFLAEVPVADAAGREGHAGT